MRTRFAVVLVLAVLALQCYCETPEQLQQRLNNAIQQGQTDFTIAPGDYYFRNSTFLVKAAKSLNINAYGATMWFEIGAGVLLSESHNTALKGLTIDYDPPCFYQGTVMNDAVSSDGKIVFDAQTDSGFTAPDVFISKYNSPNGGGVVGPIFFDPQAKNMLPNQGQWGTYMTFESKPNNVYTFNVQGMNFWPKKGQKVVVVSRVSFTYNVQNSSQILSEDITIHGASFMAITEFDGEGANMYNNMKVIRKGNNMVASNADGFHSSGCKYGPTLENSEISFLIDDFFNVHNTFQVYCDKPAPNSLLIIDPHIYQGPDNSAYGTSSTFTNLKPGNTLSFYALNSLSYLTYATVQSVTHITDQNKINFCNKVHDIINAPPYNANMLPLNVHLYQVNFTQDLPASIKPYVVINFDEWENVGAVIKNSYFHDSYSNFGRWKSINGTITGNTFKSTRFQNLEVTPLQTWYEGPLNPHNVTISNNTFYGSGSDPIHASYSYDIHDIGNKFISENE